jgi:hypothetical protein
MLIFEFRRGDQTHVTPARTLLDATLTLPHDWKQPGPAGLSVKSYPATELDYWRTRCQLLEQQLHAALRRPAS